MFQTSYRPRVQVAQRLFLVFMADTVVRARSASQSTGRNHEKVKLRCGSFVSRLRNGIRGHCGADLGDRRVAYSE